MDIPLDLLHLDSNNVRFKHLLRENLTEKEMEEEIWADNEAKSLYRQIKFAGGLSEKPFVQSQSDGYVVKEGNMRTVCLRKLRNAVKEGREEIPLENIKIVRCIVLPDNMEADIAVYLSRVHVSGKSQ
jgi:hypothetical protein